MNFEYLYSIHMVNGCAMGGTVCHTSRKCIIDLLSNLKIVKKNMIVNFQILGNLLLIYYVI